MSFVLGDFETRSPCNLEKCGAWVYSEHPQTEILCFAYSIDGASPKIWTPDDGPPRDLFSALENGAVLIAHNVSFEKSIWRNIATKRYGWPYPTSFYDTMATCARKGLPLNLDEAGRALRLTEQKSARGKELMALLCWPRKDGTFNEDPILHEEFRKYCAQDVKAELALFKRTGNIGPEEYKVWRLDQTINERGVLLDMEYVKACRDLAAKALPPLAEEFERLTGITPAKNALSGATRREKVLDWLHAHGAQLKDLKKETVDEVLEDQMVSGCVELPDVCDQVLRLRQKLTSTSLAKLEAMCDTVGADGVARWLLQYHGAGTGRWAGRLIQPQNFPRAKVKGAKVDDVYATIMFGDVGLAAARFGCPIDLVTTGLRHAIIARPGKVICARDFSTIEARVAMGIAGAKALEIFKDKSKDIYCENASQIFNTKVDKAIAKDENHPDHKQHAEWRQTGKNCLGASTRVLTKRGWVPIIKVRAEDQLWDGATWVNHEGLLRQGRKQVNRVAGVWMTPEHPVLVDGRWWPSVLVRQTKPLGRALATALAGLSSLVTNMGFAAAFELLVSTISPRAFSGAKIRNPNSIRRGCWGWRNVYDLANAGPRQRFTILSDVGPLIVHNSVLGLGFQMGADKFKARYAKKQPMEFAKMVVDAYREKFAPEVPKLWRGLEKAGVDCVWERRKTEAFGCEFRLSDGWLLLRLPSGRELFYFNPTPFRKTMPWSTPEEPDIRAAWKFQARKTGHWTWVDAYGGLLTENVVQASARDLMAQAMLRAEANGFQVILTVHDEIVCEADKSSGLDDKVLGEIMCEQPPWAKALGIPIATEGFTGERYRK